MTLEEMLMNVRKPGRYTGGEWNAVKKQWGDDKVKFLLAFPDLYEVGMSYLGMKILYGILNNREDCLCERAFSPWVDFEKLLRENNFPLFSLESRKPIGEFDIIGFSLAYELSYTNVLNILDLGRIPLRSSERSNGDPLVIAGGPCCYNPEPMSEFIDAFLIGDGEEAIGEIVEAYKVSRHQNVKVSRKELLMRLSKIEGIYVPSFYEKGIRPKIKKRIIENLDDAFYPTKQIVPNIQIVHDRLALEIMRGCKNACKFCQASATYRPCRERSVANILMLAKEAYRMTGFDEISLLSLSSGDYSGIKEAIDALNDEFAGKSVSISVPSLRIEEIVDKLPQLISKVKRPGLTFAPEAGDDSLRRRINKNIDIKKLFDAALESFRLGWRRVKLYYMIGLPGEKEEDVMKIADMLYKISDLKRKSDGKSAHVTASVNAFIPKPHTPFEREPMDPREALEKKKMILRKAIKSKMIELDFHSFDMSYIEALLSRGDREVCGLIYETWKDGSRFDGWQELFSIDRWIVSAEKIGLDHASYVLQGRDSASRLPWDFIDTSPAHLTKNNIYSILS